MITKFQKAKVGEKIELLDPRTEQDFQKIGYTSVQRDFKITKIRELEMGEHEHNVLLHTIHEPTGLERLVWLVEFDGAYDVKIFEKPSDFVPMSRLDLLESGGGWMFCDFSDGQYENPGDVPYSDLVFDEIKQEYPRIQRDEVGNDGEYDVSIVEYHGNESIVNNELIFIETGHLDNVNGGFIEFYQGRRVFEYHVKFKSLFNILR